MGQRLTLDGLTFSNFPVSPVAMSPVNHFLYPVMIVAGWLLSVTFCPADQPVTLSELPTPAQSALKEQVGKGTLNGVLRTSEFPVAAFAATYARDKKNWTVTVNAEGKLLRQQILTAHLPEAVRPMFKKTMGTGKLQKLEKVWEDGKPTYEVELTRSGRTGGFTLDEAGTLLSKRVELKDAPAAARKTIAATADGADISSIRRIYTEGEQDYRVTIQNAGTTRSFLVESDGTLLTLQAFQAELPALAQRTLRSQLGAARLGEIHKHFSGDEFTFHIEFARQGKVQSLNLDAEGNLIDVQVNLPDAPAAVQRLVRQLLGEGDVDQIFKTFTKRTTTFEVTKHVNDREQTLSISSVGKLLECKLDVPYATLPAVVRKTAETKQPSLKCEHAVKRMDSSGTVFVLEFMRADRSLFLVLYEDGDIARQVREMALAEASPEIQRTVQRQMGKGKLVSLLEETDAEDSKVYLVEFIRDGIRRDFVVSSNGKVLK